MIDYRNNTLTLLDEPGIDEIIYGRSEKYRPIDFDFEINVKPSCISDYIEDIMSDKKFLSIHNPNTALEKFETNILPILVMCIDFSRKHMPEINGQQGIREIFQDFVRKGGLPQCLTLLDIDRTDGTSDCILSAIDRVSSAEELSEDIKKRCMRLFNILNYLEYIDTGLTFNSIIPESLYGKIKEFIKFGLCILEQGYDAKFPSDLLDNIQYTDSEYSNIEAETFKINSTKGIRYSKKIFIMDGYEFKTEKDKKFLRNVLSVENTKLIRSVYFKNCYFNFNFNPYMAGPIDILFQDCRFEKCFGLCGTSIKSMGFYRCSFLNKINLLLGAPKIPYNLTLLECFFEKGSCCSINTMAGKTDNIPTLYIENTFFNGELSILNNSQKEFNITMKNVSFGSPFQIKDDLHLSNSSIFENLIFSSIPSIQMDKSRKDLYDVMKKAGLEKRAKDLGIYAVDETKETTDFDYDAYKVAYETGYLKSEYAAYLLEKSVSYLGQKRKKDRETPSRDSIPFIGEGKNIKYPVEALLAYKAKDWEKLKELRQKYKEIVD